jgi:hypothetical protein
MHKLLQLKDKCSAQEFDHADAAAACRNNYMGTMELMRVAAGFEQLRSFVHGAVR